MYSTEHIALGFIAAMKKEAMLDCEQRLAIFAWTYIDYPGPRSNKLTITMHSNTVTAGPQHVRCNLMWGLKTLSKQLIRDDFRKGTRFFEWFGSPSRHAVEVYYGLFGDLSSLDLMELTTNRTINSEEMAVQDNQTMGLTPNATTSLDIPGSSNANIFIVIKFAENPLSQSLIFSTVLESLMEFAQRDVNREIQRLSFTSSIFPVWLFATSYPQLTPGFIFTTLHMILVAEALAKECVVKGLYKELLWDFFADGKWAAGGCLTTPIQSRAFCAGLRPALGGISGNKTNMYASQE